MKKNGFTLMELLAVIAIIGILAAIAIPNVVDSYNNALKKKMAVEEENMVDAALLYVEDHCLSPIAGYTCPDTFNIGTNSGYVCLSHLQGGGDSYINEIKFKETVCNGYVQVSKGTGKGYVFCGTDYVTDSTKSMPTC